MRAGRGEREWGGKNRAWALFEKNRGAGGGEKRGSWGRGGDSACGSSRERGRSGGRFEGDGADRRARPVSG